MSEEIVKPVRDSEPVKNGGTVTLVFETGTAASGLPVVNSFTPSGELNADLKYKYDYDEFVNTAILEANVETKELVAAVPNRKIEVVSYVMVTSAASTVTWKSGSTAISSGMPLAANGGVSANNSEGLLRTSAGEALNLTNSAGTVNGHISYKVK